MSVNKSYAVIGLGRYGMAVAVELVKSGAEIIAIDVDEAKVNSAASVIPICKCADITDPDVVRQLGLSNIDVVIVSMANCLDASVMAITLCKEAGVKTVIAKCGSEMQRRIFIRVGADKVVFPESESGARLAKNLLSSGFADLVELAGDASMVTLDIPSEWIGSSLIDLNLRKKYGINVVAIQKEDSVEVTIDPTAPLTSDMQLIVIANTAKLAKFSKKKKK